MRHTTVHLLDIAGKKRAAVDEEQRLSLLRDLMAAMDRCSVAMREFRSIISEMDEPVRMRLWEAVAEERDQANGPPADNAWRAFPGVD